MIPTTYIDDLLARYDTLLLDAYGVLVTANGALPGAAELIQRLEDSGQPYFIVTNDASRLPAGIAERLTGLGLPVDGSRIITSGELLKPYFEAHGLVGCTTAVLGPEDSRAYVEAAGGHVVAPDEPFEVLATCDDRGTPFLEGANQALSTAYAQLERGITPRLVDPNPDLIAPHGNGQFGFTAGALALLIEQGLALRYPQRCCDLTFDRLGKPETPLFEAAIRRAGTTNVVMVGDQLATDIAGANAAGIDSVLIAGGVASGDQPGAGTRPTWIMPPLATA